MAVSCPGDLQVLMFGFGDLRRLVFGLMLAAASTSVANAVTPVKVGDSLREFLQYDFHVNIPLQLDEQCCEQQLVPQVFSAVELPLWLNNVSLSAADALSIKLPRLPVDQQHLASSSHDYLNVRTAELERLAAKLLVRDVKADQVIAEQQALQQRLGDSLLQRQQLLGELVLLRDKALPSFEQAEESPRIMQERVNGKRFHSMEKLSELTGKRN